ncbi:MAG: SpoIIE family protein phosphatase [Gammaproteobacteria bacterium]|nr:SpoIIE family protein phosphatase [Gammaproteobacteria bacterium]
MIENEIRAGRMTRYRFWFTGIFIIFFCTSLFAQNGPNSDGDMSVPPRLSYKPGNKHVLLLNSYNKGYAWTDNEVLAVEEAFADQHQILLSVEYMDTKLTNTPQYMEQWKELFATKFGNVDFDVIIATDDDALKFLRQYRSLLFPDVPVVFAGINNFQAAKIDGFSNVTGVNEQADFRSNLDLIIQLQPRVKNVYVIVDELTAGTLIRQEFESTAKYFSDRLQFHYLTGLTMGALVDKVRKLEKDSVVFYLSFFRDKDNFSFAPWEAIPVISRNASVPLYGQVDYMLGKGILGGRVKSSYYQGKEAAKLAHRILAGESAEDIPVVMQSPNYYMFDYDQLKRFKISIRALPEGSIIVNEPQTFYYRYKQLIWIVSGLIVVLLTFILVLLFNISQRRRAQRGLQHIIDVMGSMFQKGSVESMGGDLLETINKVIFPEKHIDMVKVYHYGGGMGAFKADQLLPSPSNNNDDGDDDSSVRLIKKSIESDSCTVSQNECVALFNTRALHTSLTYFKAKRKFDEMDRKMLEILTRNVSMAMDSFEDTKTIESLETARRIQLSMLPHDFSEVAAPFGIDIHAHLVAAKEVGGDLYDVFALDADRLCLVVGDVSDKGVPAALFMAMAKTLIRSSAEQGFEPNKILEQVNNQLFRDNEECMFVTLFLAVFDRRSDLVRYANGGHNPPCRISADGTVSWLPMEPGLALGLVENVDYTLQSSILERGEGLFAYTDGVTEAMNLESEQFGEDRLEQFLLENASLKAAVLNKKLIEAVGQFAGGAQQSDDITVLLIRNERAEKGG